ncbi:dystroglycan 1-like isoform X2 [Gallus gallus]|uniref:dystroglycan 1-like isoform X2 n=1 Tax=Gallus gallus TaxID=9031 RepID=UPI001AE81F51|nr:dystroglycan 1-like isoform X2 [Gallus gallus]
MQLHLGPSAAATSRVCTELCRETPFGCSECYIPPAGHATASSSWRPSGLSLGQEQRWEQQQLKSIMSWLCAARYFPMRGLQLNRAAAVTLASGANLPSWLDFNPNTNMLQGLPMTGESGAYLISITASGRTCAQRVAVKFTIHVQDSILFLDTENSLNHIPNRHQCGKEVPITSAEIILSTGAKTLEAQERLYIVYVISEYLHLDSSLVTLLQYTDVVHRNLQNLTVLARDTSHIDFTVNRYVGLSWPVKCGELAVLREFIHVLQRNIDSHHLSQLLGYEISGWRILRRGSYKRKSPRQQRRQLMITPTPTLKVIRITQRPAVVAPSPLFSAVPSRLLLQLAVSPTQSLYKESITTASYEMQSKNHPVSQESLVTLKMDSARDTPTNNPTIAVMFGDTSSSDLSPSLVPKSVLLFTELEVLPTSSRGVSSLLQQPEPHVPHTDLYFHSSKTEVYGSHLLQDVTSNKDLFPRPTYTLMINTLHEWPHTLTEALSSKTEHHVFLPQETSTSEMPDYSDKAKSHFPKSEMLSSASLSLERLLSLSSNTLLTATASSDFTFPINYMFPPSPASSSPSQELAHGHELLSKSSETMPTSYRLPFIEGKSTVSSMIQSEPQILYPKLNFHTEISACISISLYSPFPGEAKTSYESSPLILSHPDSTPVLTLTPPIIHSTYGGSMLKTQMQSPSILSTKELHSGRDPGTGIIFPNIIEPSLESHTISVEVPLVTLFTAASHLFNSVPEPIQTLPPSHPDASTLQLPTDETLQSTESTGILPPFSILQELQNKTPGQTNTSPKVVHSIEFITATIGCLFSFPVSANTFFDEEDGNSTQLSLQLIPADGSPGGSESWLQFDVSQQTMRGYPLDIDFQYSPQEFILSATDSGGLTVWQSFTIELLKPTHVPCHLYTIRTKNSYYSFLRERKRISLFLEKLSLYLNSTNPKDIVMTTLKPGSTLISWYNSSLCTSANRPFSWCAKEEIQEALNKLRVPDGYVSPHFIQAMLPEYKIDVIFNISYSNNCFPTTKPFGGSFNSTVPTLQGWGDSNIIKPPSALLSSLCVTVGLVLLTLVYCSCKYYSKIPEYKFMTFQSNSQLSHVDVAMDVLQPRKVPVHECGGSPSHSLWLPPLLSLTSPEQCPRSVRLSHIIPSSQPPKYQLPPHYQEGITTQDDRGSICRY